MSVFSTFSEESFFSGISVKAGFQWFSNKNMKMTQSYFLLTLVTMKLLPKMFIKTVKKMF